MAQYTGDSAFSKRRVVTKTLALIFSLSFFFSCKPTKRRKKISLDLLSVTKGIWGKSLTLVLFGWHRGRGGAQCKPPLPNPSLSMISTSRCPRPPIDERHPARTLTPAPSCSDAARAPHARPAIGMATVGIAVWPARNRPPPSLSSRRQVYLDMVNQFPIAKTGENPRAPPLDRARSTSSGYPECAARGSRSRAHQPPPAPPITHACTAPCCKPNATIALPRVALASPR
jgi:hypothetical protein